MPAGVRQSSLPGAVDIPYQPERASRWLTLGRPQGGTVDFVKESSAPMRERSLTPTPHDTMAAERQP